MMITPDLVVRARSSEEQPSARRPQLRAAARSNRRAGRYLKFQRPDCPGERGFGQALRRTGYGRRARGIAIRELVPWPIRWLIHQDSLASAAGLDAAVDRALRGRWLRHHESSQAVHRGRQPRSSGSGRTETVREPEASLPQRPTAGERGFGQALRRSVPAFPEIAIRELVANALIHQDSLASAAGPMVEIFPGRIEVTNPGEPLVDTQRLLDSPPRSRNEVLASLMRRFRICPGFGNHRESSVVERGRRAVRDVDRQPALNLVLRA